MTNCAHLKDAKESIEANTPQGCEECLRDGTHWIQLRICLACGHIGCCDSSLGKHATKHFKSTGHPVMAEFPSRSWKWCYVDNDYVG
jgi:CPA1 family monovalent cation:H+ antiporter